MPGGKEKTRSKVDKPGSLQMRGLALEPEQRKRKGGGEKDQKKSITLQATKEGRQEAPVQT